MRVEHSATTEFGVEQEWANGERFVAPAGSRDAARQVVAAGGVWNPRPVRVVSRICGPWLVEDSTEEEAR